MSHFLIVFALLRLLRMSVNQRFWVFGRLHILKFLENFPSRVTICYALHTHPKFCLEKLGTPFVFFCFTSLFCHGCALSFLFLSFLVPCSFSLYLLDLGFRPELALYTFGKFKFSFLSSLWSLFSFHHCFVEIGLQDGIDTWHLSGFQVLVLPRLRSLFPLCSFCLVWVLVSDQNWNKEPFQGSCSWFLLDPCSSLFLQVLFGFAFLVWSQSWSPYFCHVIFFLSSSFVHFFWSFLLSRLSVFPSSFSSHLYFMTVIGSPLFLHLWFCVVIGLIVASLVI